MPQKTFEAEGIGKIVVYKRRGARNIRLSINSRRQVKVTLPNYIPYSTGLKFALGKKEWIAKHLLTPQASLSDGDGIGKSFRIHVETSRKGMPKKPVAIKGQQIVVYSENLDLNHLHKDIEVACVKALKKDSENLLPIRVSELSKKYHYQYKSIKIKKLTSRWGSCSSTGDISLSLFLIQLPWELIDYVILHELNHTQHLHHQKAFWDSLNAILPNAKQLRKLTKSYKSVVMPKTALK